MKRPRRLFLQLAAGAVALPSVSRFAWAQTYPTRPVHFAHASADQAQALAKELVAGPRAELAATSSDRRRCQRLM